MMLLPKDWKRLSSELTLVHAVLAAALLVPLCLFAQAAAPVAWARHAAAVAGLVFLVATVSIVYAISSRVSHLLSDLSGRAARIGQGDPNVSFEQTSSISPDEVGKLAGALDSMVENLKAAHKRTLDINAGLERTVRDRMEELQRKNRQIETQNKQVMEASRLKSQFLANMSHELRTPLNAVLALSDILGNKMSGELNDEQVKQVSIINRSGKSLLRLIDDVLDLSKIEAGRMNVEKAPMALHTLTTLIADTLKPLAEDKGISLSVTLAPGLPEFIKGDEGKLRQILINLVGNGIKFTEHGSVKMYVSHTSSPQMIAFTIVDTGIGIASDSTERIFDEFCQADGSTTRKYGGTGLGLTISRRMAELMGGSLNVDSSLGAGSRFTLTVPYEPAPPVPATATETLRRVRMHVPEPLLMATVDDSATAMRDSRPIVLVAEDEPDNLYVMKQYLNRLGCQVVFARDGNEVMPKTRQYKPIAIALDLVLPKRSGWEVLSELKTDADTRHIPVIVCSALDNQERGFCMGAYRYLIKPIDETELEDAILHIKAAERRFIKRVLVVDSNVVDADLMARLLTENKYDVLRAGSGEEGIATSARERPDLIVLQLEAGGTGSFKVIDALKRRPETREIPVVAYTDIDLTPSEEAQLKREVACLFPKTPFDPTRILSEIGALMKRDTKAEESPDSATAPANVPSAERAVASVKSKQARKRILLVEDDPNNQYTIEFLLKSEGYEVLLAEDGRVGLERAKELRPDIVLMDMMMPVLGGHEATRLLKQTPELKQTPVIALTAAAMVGDREKALAAGCDDYVSKPIAQAELFEKIEHWLETSTASTKEAVSPSGFQTGKLEPPMTIEPTTN